MSSCTFIVHVTDHFYGLQTQNIAKSAFGEAYAAPGLFAMDAATAAYQVRHRCQCQSALKKEILISSER